LDVLGIKNAEKLVPLPDDQKPTDPVSENQAAIKGKPLKAFLFQNHQAHIQVHQSMLQDPVIMAVIGQNPQAQQIMAALQAHMAEHMGYVYRQNIEEQLGMALPPEDEKMSPQLETALSGMMAQAAQQVTQQHQAQAAQQQAQQQAQDPVLQMQQQELAIAQQEVQIKAQKQATEAKLAEGRLQLDAMKVGVDIKKAQHQIDSRDAQVGVQTGVDIAKHRAQQDLTARQAALEHGRELMQTDIDAKKTALKHGENLADRLHTIGKEKLDKEQQRLQMEQQARIARSQPKGKSNE